MKRKILVLYYSQSGQLRDILDSMVQDVRDHADVDIVEVEPVQPFPFPWTSEAFFDAMPECVELIPSPVKPLPQQIMDTDYDLVVYGYQSWFLSPSQPTTSFLKSEYASVMKDKPVVTVIGCRNMWLNAQEQVKLMLTAIGARLVGNIVLVDKHPNLVSVLSIMRWAFKGQKEASGMLPEAGVSKHDIQDTRRFGMPIYNHLADGKLDTLQEALLKLNAVELEPGLVLLERRGIKNFRKFAAYIREKGGPGDPARKGRVNLFKRLLATGIFVLSPISSFTAAIQERMQQKRLLQDVQYFKQLQYEADRI